MRHNLAVFWATRDELPMPQEQEVELRLTQNDATVIATWLINRRPIGKTIINASDLSACTELIRKDLSAICAYVRTNEKLSSELDKNFAEYNSLLDRLREDGRDLSNLLLARGRSRSADSNRIEQYLAQAPHGSTLALFVEDEHLRRLPALHLPHETATSPPR